MKTDQINYSHSKDTPHFHFEYSFRSHCAFQYGRVQGDPLALHGVYNQDYILRFITALEDSWKYFEDREWEMPPCPIRVVFCDLVDCYGKTRPDDNSFPLRKNVRIEFASRHEDPQGPCNEALIKPLAAHELCHVIQANLHPDCLTDKDPWAWFSEATATYMQTAFCNTSTEHFRSMFRWFDEPNRQLYLLNGSREYGGVVFCKFLTDRFGPDFLRDVWKMAPAVKSPFKAIEKCAQRHESIQFASPSSPDLFLSEFLVSLFFLDNGHVLGSDYRQRFQHVFAELHRKENRIEGKLLSPLSARYHLIKVPDKNSKEVELKLEVRASFSIPQGQSPGKAAVCMIDKNLKQINDKHFELYLNPEERTDWYKHEESFGWPASTDVDYILVIVANTEWKSQPEDQVILIGPRAIEEYAINVKFP
ncbi:MAG: DUF6055 domain-containing protein [Thermoguttaceae bacterium]|jgi:hypothetical protein